MRSTRRSPWPMVVSTLAHIAVVTLVIVLPLLYVTDSLPTPPTMMAFVATAPPPPPPPPPPPAPRVAAAAPKPVAADAFAAPVEAPPSIAPETGIDTGIEGGVPGGVEGGVPGGVIGGIVGGLPDDTPPPPPPPPVKRAAVRVGGKIERPALVNRVEPVYPKIAVEARVSGTVILEVTVDDTGRVTDARVLRSIVLLDDAALDAVRHWRYSPLLLNGEAHPFIVTVTVTFRLPSAGDAASGTRP